jgi:hypothetical protein
MLFLLLACSSSKDSPPDTSSKQIVTGCLAKTPDLNIGTGEQNFEALTENDPVTMVHGPQGGWHILGSLAFENLKQIVEIDFQVFDLDSGVRIVNNYYRVAMLLDGDCSGYYVGMYGYLNVNELIDGEINTPPEILGGRNLKLFFHVTDCSQTMEANGECSSDTRFVEKELIVTAALDPIDIPPEDTGNN